MPAMFLTDEQMVELTGYSQKTKQIQALVKMKIPHNVRASDGKPRVLVSVLTGSANDEQKDEDFKPNWNAI